MLKCWVPSLLLVMIIENIPILHETHYTIRIKHVLERSRLMKIAIQTIFYAITMIILISFCLDSLKMILPISTYRLLLNTHVKNLWFFRLNLKEKGKKDE